MSIIIMLLCAISQAQVHKRYFDRYGKVTKDSAKAFTYVMFQRTADSNEYSAVWLTKKNVPFRKGYYLDEELTIPHGRVTNYRQTIRQTKISEHQSTVDTMMYLSETTYYNNGMREGDHVFYDSFGRKLSIEKFADDTLNGSAEL